MICDYIGRFRSFLCVFAFQGSLLVILITIDGSEKQLLKAAFERQSSRAFENRSKDTLLLRATVRKNRPKS